MLYTLEQIIISKKKKFKNLPFFNLVSFSNVSVPLTEYLSRKDCLAGRRHRSQPQKRYKKIINLIHSLFLLLYSLRNAWLSEVLWFVILKKYFFCFHKSEPSHFLHKPGRWSNPDTFIPRTVRWWGSASFLARGSHPSLLKLSTGTPVHSEGMPWQEVTEMSGGQQEDGEGAGHSSKQLLKENKGCKKVGLGSGQRERVDPRWRGSARESRGWWHNPHLGNFPSAEGWDLLLPLFLLQVINFHPSFLWETVDKTGSEIKKLSLCHLSLLVSDFILCVCFTSNLELFNLLFTVSRTVFLNLLKGRYRKVWLKHSTNLCLHLSYPYGQLNIPLIFLMNSNLTFFCVVLGNQPRLKGTITHGCFHYTKCVLFKTHRMLFHGPFP